MAGMDDEEWQARHRRKSRWLKRLVALSAFLAAGAWLLLAAQWPERCLYVAEEMASMLQQFACSTDLLKGGVTEKALFVWLWTVPTLLIGAGILRLIDELRRRMQ